jgi:hypothetical protein
MQLSGNDVPIMAIDAVSPLRDNLQNQRRQAARQTTTRSRNVAAPSDLTKCAVCSYRMSLLSRKHDYVVLGCNTCQVSLSLPTATWERLTTQRSR